MAERTVYVSENGLDTNDGSLGMVVSKEEDQKWAPISIAEKASQMYQADVRKQAAGAKKAVEAIAHDAADA